MKTNINVLIRGKTMIYVGRLIDEKHDKYIITDASWIAETGRFSNFLDTGIPIECEPYPDSMIIEVERHDVVEIANWPHPLLREQIG